MAMNSLESPQNTSDSADSYVSNLHMLSSKVIDGKFECFLGSEKVIDLPYFKTYLLSTN